MKKKQSKINQEEFRFIAKKYNEWIRYCAEQKSPNTLISYKKTFKLFFVDFLLEHKRLVDTHFNSHIVFGREMVEEWLAWLRDSKGDSPQTCNLRLSNLNAFLKYLAFKEPQYQSISLSTREIPYKRPLARKVSALSREAIKAVINAPDISRRVGYRDTVMMGLMYATAGRLNEILSIRLKDIKLTISNHGHSSITFLGKGNKYRVINLLDPTIQQLKVYIRSFHGDNPNDDDLLFYTNIHGRKCKMSQKNVSLRLRKYAEIAHRTCKDVPLTLHSHQFRHTRATLWLEENHKLAVVSKLLGHESIETTMRYLDITEEMIADATRKTRNELANTIQPIWDKETDLSSFFDF